MTPQKQLFLHNPPDTYGDCARTCYACLLDIAPEEVPHFAEMYWEDVPAWRKAEREFLATKGLVPVVFGYVCHLEELLKFMRDANPDVYYILLGTSSNGTPHDVICLNDKIVWDPSIDNSGIVGPLKKEQAYYVTLFVPTSYSNQAGRIV